MSTERNGALLTISGLRAGYGVSEVLHDVALHLDEGEAIAVLGPNGAGKTTLLRSVFQTCRVFGGSIALEGLDLLSVSSHEVTRHGVGIVPEGRGLFPEMSVNDNLLVGGLRLGGRGQVRERLREVSEIFPVLADRSDQIVGTMSGGEQQMVAIARALMTRPRVLLLDEPSLGLGPLIVEEIFRRLGALRDEGIALIVVEQRVQEALEVADRAYIVSGGEIVVEGRTSELSIDEVLVDAFFGARDSEVAHAGGGPGE